MGARLRKLKNRLLELVRRDETRDRSGGGRIRPAELLRVALGGFAVLFIIYTLFLAARFAETDADDLGYPQRVLADASWVANPGATIAPAEAAPDAEGETCAPSWTARTLIFIIETLVEDNLWIPGDPQYKLGWFGLGSFESGPFFDNEAYFQLGALRAVRRLSVEFVDLLGRARGTSGIDEALSDARGALHWNERAWHVNPFDSRVPFLATSAASSYRRAVKHLKDYDQRLTRCDALFDSRADNLFLVLDRIANDVGSMTDTLATRSKGVRWSVEEKKMVPGEGNDHGFFDFRADDLFHEAHGQMWAYHGILQALRIDFGSTVQQNNLDQVWDRLERHVAETAALDPAIVSNGREDAVFQPDHLSIMAVNMLRARANLVELREILAR